MARGDSTTSFGGPHRCRPLQCLCQGNTTAHGCPTMIFAVLIRCYYNQGFGASITSLISRHVIECIGTQFVDDTDLYTYLPWLRSSYEVHLEMQKSVTIWGLEKSYLYNINYMHNKFSVWDYAEMANQTLAVPLPNGSQIPTS